MTTFIKAEEQNYSLYNYVNLLNQENDALEESNKNLSRQIGHYRNMSEMSEQGKQQNIQ